MSLALSNMRNKRRPKPEPLEQVKALVCGRCWTNCFDTEGFEKLGQLEITEFKYTSIRTDPSISYEQDCPWCSYLFSLEEIFRDSFQYCSPSPYTVTFKVSDRWTATPPGNNIYGLGLVSENGYVYDDGEEIIMFTQEDNIAAQQVTARNLASDVSPSSTCKEILRWIKACANHECCPEQVDTTLPTRVVDVTTLRVVNTMGKSGKYAALSYCWGASTQATLNSSTFHAFSRHIDFDVFSQTIKDAILVARSLSIDYLWVDALCIIQDDDADKINELGSMARIYGNAHITIMASSAKDTSEGFLGTRDSNDNSAYKRGMVLPYRVSANIFGIVTVLKSPGLAGPEPIDRRAWTLQEQLLSRRLLLYSSHTLQWRCAAGTVNLCQSLDMEYPKLRRTKLLSQLSTRPKEAFIEWSHLIGNYSSRSLSVPQDKLPAVAALAEKFAPILGQYYAGIWSYSIITQLNWQIAPWTLQNECSVNTVDDQTVYRAPSWSWTSVEGEICLPVAEPQDQVVCTLISINTLPKDRTVPYGEVIDGSITIRATLILGWIDRLKRIEDLDFVVHASHHLPGSPSTKFFVTYFQHSCFRTAPSVDNPVAPILVDSYRRQGYCGLVYLLPLFSSTSHLYARYLSDAGDDGVVPTYYGLILVPAGPSTFRRIGRFRNLHQSELDGIPEQEITIV